MMVYEDILQYLYASTPAFHKVGVAAYKPGLENTLRLMKALDNPHLKFRSVHVAGTNGKGSTSHMIAAVLQSAGYKTGLYTSPHLVDFRERIRVNGEMIPREEVVHFVEQNKALLEDIHPSFFETTMAMAFQYFAEQRVDIAVVEVGLGGRLDSTNIITPEVSVITNIGFDHTEFLGNTLAQIASEKAGIIKRNIPVVIGEANSETLPVFNDKSAEMNAEMVFVDADAEIPECQLKGAYQEKNISTVLAAVNVLRQQGWHIPDELTGLQGRWQKLTYKGKTIILDTGHNSHGIKSYINDLNAIDRLHIVFGMVSDKDVDAVLSLMPQNAIYYFTQASTKRAIPAKDMLQKGMECGLHGRAYMTVAEALNAATDNAAANDTVFIGGSNYVVGEALKTLQGL